MATGTESPSEAAVARPSASGFGLVSRRYSPAEEWADALVHGLALALAVIGCAALVLPPLAAGDYRRAAIFGVYGLSLLTVYASSALNQRFRWHRWRPFFRLMDHAVIYGLIAGTYTPLALLALPQPLGARLLALVWSLAGLGIALKLAFGHRYDWFCLLLYLAMGWLSLAKLGTISEALGQDGMAWLLGGGLAYTAGVIFFLWDRLPFSNAIWHGLCLIGSAAHFVLIARYLSAPAA